MVLPLYCLGSERNGCWSCQVYKCFNRPQSKNWDSAALVWHSFLHVQLMLPHGVLRHGVRSCICCHDSVYQLILGRSIVLRFPIWYLLIHNLDWHFIPHEFLDSDPGDPGFLLHHRGLKIFCRPFFQSRVKLSKSKHPFH